MSADPWPEGVGRLILEEVDSTNSEAGRRATALAGPTWILARRQTCGRGRRGRPWSDPAGNFAATLLMRPPGPPEQVALLSFAAALAVFDACVAVIGRAEMFSLKWPNDVLLNGGKLAGILLESAGNGAGVAHVCIGIGLNLVSSPEITGAAPGTRPPANLLAATGARVTPEEFLDHLAPACAGRVRQLVTYGFDPVRRAWLARAAHLGEPMTARTLRDATTGTFETVDETGNLVLMTPTGRRAIAAADVFFGEG